jgi:putative nucleotidyltransferase with HDIG domain
MSKPAGTSFRAASGTSATRRSPAAVSLGTATRTAASLGCRAVEREGNWERGWKRIVVPTLASLSAAIEARDPYLRGHSARVTAYAEALARRLGWAGPKLEELRLGGALHDVGKMRVSEGVLRKDGQLEPHEAEEMRRHPAEGVRLIAGIERFRPALPYVLFHHERWDGGGYPTGRRGDDIPMEARILALADCFDAMISTRPYRPALPIDYALGEVERCAGSQFDPELAELFLCTWQSVDVETGVAAAV